MSSKRKQNPKFQDERDNKAQPIIAKSPGQIEYIVALQRSIVVVATGSAGTGKTYVASAHAANRLVRGEVENVILSRPYVVMGKSCGLFPGTIYDKLEPFLKPMMNVLKTRLGENDYDSRVRAGKLSIQALEAIRGMSFENSILIIDEAQNTTPEDMKSIVTRIGENCQLILCGDATQSDIRGPNGLDFISNIIEDYQVAQAEVVNFYPDDVVRSGITRRFVQIFDKLGGNK
jgi:phosphate starvation-inducible PhoH-like protein